MESVQEKNLLCWKAWDCVAKWINWWPLALTAILFHTYKNYRLAGVPQLRQCKKKSFKGCYTNPTLLHKGPGNSILVLHQQHQPVFLLRYMTWICTIASQALERSSTSLRWCISQRKPDEPEDHSALLQGWPPLCSVIQTGRTRKKVLLSLIYATAQCLVMACPLTLLGLLTLCWAQEPSTCKHTCTQRTSVSFVWFSCWWWFFVLFTMVSSRSNFETSNLIVSPCTL